MDHENKKTPLYERHKSAGAKMGNFGDYTMPLWYSSVRDEHLGVLARAGVFDTSHMAAVTLKGKNARQLLQLCFTKNLDECIGKMKKPIQNGRCVYGAFLNPKGEVLDDAVLFKLDEEFYMIIVNSGKGKLIADHLEKHKEGEETVIEDLTNKLVKIDVQGPMAAKILAGVLEDSADLFRQMPYFSFKGHFDPDSVLSRNARLSGVPVLLSRTGYTGEFGFEIFAVADQAVRLWDIVMEAGHDFGLLPCGLAARDSLRAGAVLPLSQQDIGPWPFVNHPWSFALPFNDSQTEFTKRFVGDQALLGITDPEHTYPFVGNDLRKVSISDNPTVFDMEGRELGTALTCVSDMGIGRFQNRVYSALEVDKPKDFNPKGLCCGFVKVKRKLEMGTNLKIRDNRREIIVELTSDIRPARSARRPIKDML